jgi:hypothetical protein
MQSDPEFLRFFDGLRPTRYYKIARLPNETYDSVIAGPKDRFLAQGHPIKDNRLLPRGWSEQGPPGFSLPRDFLAATFPVGTGRDPVYRAARGPTAWSTRSRCRARWTRRR